MTEKYISFADFVASRSELCDLVDHVDGIDFDARGYHYMGGCYIEVQDEANAIHPELIDRDYCVTVGNSSDLFGSLDDAERFLWRSFADAELNATFLREHSLRPVRWQFGEGEEFDGYTDGSRWNGWLNVCVAPAVHAQVIETFLDSDSDAAQDFRDMQPAEFGLYDYGNCYCTSAVEDDSDEDTGPWFEPSAPELQGTDRVARRSDTLNRLHGLTFNDARQIELACEQLASADMTFHPDDDPSDIIWSVPMSDELLGQLADIIAELRTACDKLGLDISAEVMCASVRVYDKQSAFYPEYARVPRGRRFACSWTNGYQPSCDEQTSEYFCTGNGYEADVIIAIERLGTGQTFTQTDASGTHVVTRFE